MVPGPGFASRLQQIDTSIAQLTQVGAGRNTGALIDRDAPGGTFQSAALEDDAAFGSARLLYLSGIIGTLALLRIGAGLLLALAPVVAGLYFFAQSRGIFAGWLKGLVFTFAGSIGATLVLTSSLPFLAHGSPMLCGSAALDMRSRRRPPNCSRSRSPLRWCWC